VIGIGGRQGFLPICTSPNGVSTGANFSRALFPSSPSFSYFLKGIATPKCWASPLSSPFAVEIRPFSISMNLVFPLPRLMVQIPFSPFLFFFPPLPFLFSTSYRSRDRRRLGQGRAVYMKGPGSGLSLLFHLPFSFPFFPSSRRKMNIAERLRQNIRPDEEGAAPGGSLSSFPSLFSFSGPGEGVWREALPDRDRGHVFRPDLRRQSPTSGMGPLSYFPLFLFFLLSSFFSSFPSRRSEQAVGHRDRAEGRVMVTKIKAVDSILFFFFLFLPPFLPEPE